MRIAFFNANLRIGQDGVTRVMYRIFDETDARSIPSIAFTATLPEGGSPGIPMYRMRSVAIPLQKSYRLAMPGYGGFERYLNDFGADIIHVHSPCTLGFAAVKYARRYDIPVVSTYHTHFPTYPRYYKLYGFEEIVWKLMRYFYNQMDRTFVPASSILDELAEHGIQRLHHLPNGTDLKQFNPAYRSIEWRRAVGAEHRPIILFVSRLVWEKDISVLASMYTQLRSRGYDFEMVVVGDGHARTDLEQMMPGARFLGFKHGRELAEIYASSDIFVFPSTTETFGLVTVEAMASGVAPIAAKAGGAIGIIEEGVSGRFAEPLSAESMRHQVEQLLADPAERNRIAVNALKRAKLFDWGNILDSLFENYEDVVERHRQSRRSRAA